ncbi:MAG: SpoIID/LytB domain-containing protein [Bacteroidales bacterium]|nr:SpoIID/LytB domain-containing protein [Bacteroidales bacterium]MCF8391153.1 SpoIID/LytB domain-containing protein [Bacteroidales bacterium]
MLKQEPNIEVGIVGKKNISFNLSGNFQLENSPYIYFGECTASIDTNKLVIENADNRRIFDEELCFIPSNMSDQHFEIHNVLIGIDFHWEKEEDQKFQGKLKLKIIEGNIQIINILPIESYLKSVISSEMNANSSINLLKAHAIISRSWLIAQISNKKVLNQPEASEEIKKDEYIKWWDREDHHYFHVCADDHCQRYQGINRSFNPNVVKAVTETRGMVLTYENRICDARYSKSCGGYTELFENCWEGSSHPYLKSFPDIDSDDNLQIDLKTEENSRNFILNSPEAFCNTNDKKILSQVLNDYDLDTQDFYRWKLNYSQDELSSLIKKKSGIDFGKIISLEAVERGESGRIVKLKISGTDKELIIGKELVIRRWLSETHLYSSAIIFEPGNKINGIPESFTLYGSGWGHGVGLCQIGAAVMAEKKYDYSQILMHYYKDSRIEMYYS